LADPVDEEARLIGAAAPGRAIIVNVFVGSTLASEEALTAGMADSLVGRLPRKSGGLVLLLAFEKDFNDQPLSQELNTVRRGSWILPRPLSETTFGWLTISSDGDTRGVIEFSSNRSVLQTGRLSGVTFAGIERPWDDLPDWLRDRTDLCAVLACSLEGQDLLFVDLRSRCLHVHLEESLRLLQANFRASRLDEGWDEVVPGVFLTGIRPQGRGELGAHN